MMLKTREVTFRGKRLDEDRWVYGNFTTLNGNCYIVTETGEMSPAGFPILEYIPVVPESVGQCTGLVDLYGRYIFEDDVVLHVWDDPSPYLFLIKWENFCWVSINPKIKSLPPHDDLRECALGLFAERTMLFGNIHDSPELIAMLEVSGA